MKTGYTSTLTVNDVVMGSTRTCKTNQFVSFTCQTSSHYKSIISLRLKPWTNISIGHGSSKGSVPSDPSVGQPPHILVDNLSASTKSIRTRDSTGAYEPTKKSRNGWMSMYKCRMPSTESSQVLNTHLRAVSERQAMAFKINAAIGAIIKHNNNVRYFHASANNYKLFHQPLQVTRWADLEAFTNMNGNREWTEHAAM